MFIIATESKPDTTFGGRKQAFHDIPKVAKRAKEMIQDKPVWAWLCAPPLGNSWTLRQPGCAGALWDPALKGALLRRGRGLAEGRAARK